MAKRLAASAAFFLALLAAYLLVPAAMTVI